MNRLPQAWRFSAYGVVVAVLLYLTQAPAGALPPPTLWDKAQHGLAWLALAAVGLVLWPARAGRVAAFAVFLGVLVEVLQSALPFGRHGDARDLLADAIGVALALLGWAAARRRPLRPRSPIPRA